MIRCTDIGKWLHLTDPYEAMSYVSAYTYEHNNRSIITKIHTLHVLQSIAINNANKATSWSICTCTFLHLKHTKHEKITQKQKSKWETI